MKNNYKDLSIKENYEKYIAFFAVVLYNIIV